MPPALTAPGRSGFRRPTAAAGTASSTAGGCDRRKNDLAPAVHRSVPYAALGNPCAAQQAYSWACGLADVGMELGGRPGDLPAAAITDEDVVAVAVRVPEPRYCRGTVADDHVSEHHAAARRRRNPHATLPVMILSSITHLPQASPRWPGLRIAIAVGDDALRTWLSEPNPRLCPLTTRRMFSMTPGPALG